MKPKLLDQENYKLGKRKVSDMSVFVQAISLCICWIILTPRLALPVI